MGKKVSCAGIQPLFLILELQTFGEGSERVLAGYLAVRRGDESQHGAMGRSLGARELPLAVKAAMRLASRVMTRTAYYV